MLKKKALILYATMTGNTEKIAKWFKEEFEHYSFDVELFKMTYNGDDWEGMQEKLYFDDYDVICLGSPIVAGSPLQIVISALSLGGGPKGLELGKGLPERLAVWRRNEGPYMGVLPKDDYRPLGIVFSTYGGGFYGSGEATATLELLKLFLELQDCTVVGRFACCGRETGPAGLADGEQPKLHEPERFTEEERKQWLRDPESYVDADGREHKGSFFFHTHMQDKPGPRDEAKAKALVADLVEDYFFSHDGERKRVGSQYISIS